MMIVMLPTALFVIILSELALSSNNKEQQLNFGKISYGIRTLGGQWQILDKRLRRLKSIRHKLLHFRARRDAAADADAVNARTEAMGPLLSNTTTVVGHAFAPPIINTSHRSITASNRSVRAALGATSSTSLQTAHNLTVQQRHYTLLKLASAPAVQLPHELLT